MTAPGLGRARARAGVDLARLGSVVGFGAVRAAVVAAAVCVACNYGEVVVVQPAAAGHGPLTLSIQPDPEDSAVVRAVGWSTGIPGAEVTVSPADADTATGPPLAVLTTDGGGGATAPDLPDGHYLVEVRRVLTSDEMARLSPSADVIGFMAHEVVERGDHAVLTPASHRRSIVISEWAFNPEWIASAGVEYPLGGFLELYNNADTTVYLDGLVIGQGFMVAFDGFPGACARYEPWTNDPDGIWARFLDTVPGTGHDYPLAPGATALLATDGIDHSGMVPGGLDLSHADFEWIGTADVDNPGVANLVDIGVAPYPWYKHGALFGQYLASVLFLALPIDVGTLARQTMPGTQEHVYVRVPRGNILETVALRSTYAFGDPVCPHLVHANFDRHPGRMLELGYKAANIVSAHRRIAYTRPDGRRVLQHTRAAITDFVRGPRTPGSPP